MSFAASFGSIVGSTAGKTGALAKHAVLSSAGHAGVFGATLVDSARTSYSIKDQELAQRRAELNEARQLRGAVKLPKPPVSPKQRKLAV